LDRVREHLENVAPEDTRRYANGGHNCKHILVFSFVASFEVWMGQKNGGGNRRQIAGT
jgi:hypothetical protein